MEIWKDIENYEGIYQVSNFGRVKRIDKVSKRLKDGKYLTLSTTQKGYLCAKLLEKRIFVHKLVLETFDKKRIGKLQTNHKDCNKKNNNIENLEWVTQHENMRHASKNGLRPKCDGKNNSFYGKKHSKESIEKQRKAHLNISNETKLKMSESAKIRAKREGNWRLELMWKARRKE